MRAPTPVTTMAMSAESGSHRSPARTPRAGSQSNQGTSSASPVPATTPQPATTASTTPDHRDDDGQAHHHLGGGDHHHEEHRHLPVEDAQLPPGRYEGEIRGVQHQLHRHEHDHTLAPQPQAG